VHLLIPWEVHGRRYLATFRAIFTCFLSLPAARPALQSA
jgi:hypothetical protein